MARPAILFYAGTRPELIALAPLWRALSEQSRQLPFALRLVVSGQDRTELDQTLGALEIEPDEDQNVMRPYLADSLLAATLLEAAEAATRHHRAASVVVAGAGATSWAGAITAYFKGLPIVRIDQGNAPLDFQRPMPEWMHLGDLRRLAALHLCADETCAQWLREPPRESGWAPVPETAEIAVTGDPLDEMLSLDLERSRALPEDPALSALRPDAPLVLAYLRRREHHASGLRPLCEALETLAPARPDHDFAVLFSLQSHVVDALKSLVPVHENIHTLCPLPHPGFLRELARARMVLTDSLGIAQEALRLGRPTVMAGRYSASRRLAEIAMDSGAPLRIEPMEAAALAHAIGAILDAQAPPPAPKTFDMTDVGARSAEIVRAWWKKHDIASNAG